MLKTAHALAQRLSARTRWPLVCAGIGVLLALPSLWGRMLPDDDWNRLILMRPAEYASILPGRLDTYNFFDGDPARFQRGLEMGAYPWWMDAKIKVAFWRPLTSLTQWLDYRLWPQHPALMHAQSIAWFAALLILAAMLYRRLLGPGAAAVIASLMFALDDAHAAPAAFLANRNSLLACFFGLSAVHLHDRWRREGKSGMAPLASIGFTLSLLSAEAGIATMAYLAAYALCLETGDWKKRAASLMPYAALLIAWRWCWASVGAGVHGFGLYTDPGSDPLRFLGMLLRRAPLLASGQSIPAQSELQLIVSSVRPALWWVFAGVGCAFILMGWRMARRDATARFFAIGAALSLIPICATLPQDRNLIFVGFGAFGIIGSWFAHCAASPKPLLRQRALAIFFIVAHGVLGPVFFIQSEIAINELAKQVDVINGIPIGPESAGRELVLVNHPVPLLAFEALGNRAIEGAQLPEKVRLLAHAFSRVEIERLSDTRLRVRCESGFPDMVCRALGLASVRAADGATFDLKGMRAEIAQSDASGTPTEAIYDFARPLEDERYVWLQWRENHYEAFRPPAIGETVTQAPTTIFKRMPGSDFIALLRRMAPYLQYETIAAP